jgi:hypothetical protein
MTLLKPGTGNQKSNRKKAIQFIADNIMDVERIDFNSGNITTTEGMTFHVSAYAETPGAFVATPGVDRSQYSIYASGLTTLMYRQLKNDNRAFIYEVEPSEIVTKPNSSTAEWKDVEKVAKRIWVCAKDKIKLINRQKKNKHQNFEAVKTIQ